MFSLDNIKIEPNLTVEYIYRYLSDEDLFHYYIKNFKRIGEPFTSELRKDRRPSACIYKNSKGLRYKDFSDGNNFNIFDYICHKYSCTFPESLRIISTDFNLLKVKVDINPRLLVNIPEPVEKIKSEITIESQSWTLRDYEYWNSYHIPLDLLSEYNVSSAKKVFLHKNDKLSVFRYSNKNLIYAYKFEGLDSEYVKVYFPLANGDQIKWIWNGNSEILQGESQLPENGELLIVGKSLKDVICYRLIGFDAIAPQSEGSSIKRDKIDEFRGRFKRIVVNFDSDLAGIKGYQRLNKEYGLKSFIIPLESGLKDVSDFIKEKGLKETKKMIERELKVLIK